MPKKKDCTLSSLNYEVRTFPMIGESLKIQAVSLDFIFTRIFQLSNKDLDIG